MTRSFWAAGALAAAAMVASSAGCSDSAVAERERDVALADGAPTERTAEATPSPLNPPQPEYREVTIPGSTSIRARLETAVNSKTSRVEDSIEATVVAPVTIDDEVVLPAGSTIRGEVVAVEPAGKVKGRARVALRFRTLSIAGDNYPVRAELTRVAPATKGEDAKKIGLPAAGGAIVGAIVGGKEGAAIGAAAGAGAGAAVVLATPGQEVSLPKESVLAFTLQEPVTVRVPIKAGN